MESQPQNPEFRINPEDFHPVCEVRAVNRISPKRRETTNLSSKNIRCWHIGSNLMPFAGRFCPKKKSRHLSKRSKIHSPD